MLPLPTLKMSDAQLDEALALRVHTMPANSMQQLAARLQAAGARHTSRRRSSMDDALPESGGWQL